MAGQPNLPNTHFSVFCWVDWENFDYSGVRLSRSSLFILVYDCLRLRPRYLRICRVYDHIEVPQHMISSGLLARLMNL